MIDLILAPMELETKEFNVGDTVRVTISFKYTVGINTTITISAGPYSTGLFGKSLIDSCVNRKDVSLIATSTPTLQTVDVDFILVPKANGGIDNGTHGLRVWIEGTDAVVEQDNVIIVSGNPSSGGGLDILTSMAPMLMMLMMMGMVMPMVTEGEAE